MKNMVVITGQTATGKTSSALKLAREKNGELISADSRQIYKHLNIITGKDIPQISNFKFQISNPFDIGFYDIEGIRLWLYDAVDPKLPFSSFDYKICAEKVIEDIISRGKTPIIVGGTYLYIKHLLYGVETENIPPDWELRHTLEALTILDLQEKLKSLDIQMFKHLNNSDKNNPRRLIRKIEIFQSRKNSVIAIPMYEDHREKQSLPAGRQVTEIATSRPNGTRDDGKIEFIGLRYKKREDLEKNIRARVMQRLQAGAIEEVKNLLDRGYTKEDPGLNTIGYKEIIRYLEKKMTEEEMTERWILSEVQYAKRQYTFMKKNAAIDWTTL